MSGRSWEHVQLRPFACDESVLAWRQYWRDVSRHLTSGNKWLPSWTLNHSHEYLELPVAQKSRARLVRVEWQVSSRGCYADFCYESRSVRRACSQLLSEMRVMQYRRADSVRVYSGGPSLSVSIMGAEQCREQLLHRFLIEWFQSFWVTLGTSTKRTTAYGRKQDLLVWSHYSDLLYALSLPLFIPFLSQLTGMHAQLIFEPALSFLRLKFEMWHLYHNVRKFTINAARLRENGAYLQLEKQRIARYTTKNLNCTMHLLERQSMHRAMQ